MSTMRRRIREQARWARPRLIAKSDPNRDTICTDIRNRIAALPEGSVVLAEDETHLDLLARLRSCWMPTGLRHRILTPGTNVRRTVHGAVNLLTGAVHHHVSVKNVSVVFCYFLQQLLDAYPHAPAIAVITDNGSTHHSKITPTLARRTPPDPRHRRRKIQPAGQPGRTDLGRDETTDREYRNRDHHRPNPANTRVLPTPNPRPEPGHRGALDLALATRGLREGVLARGLALATLDGHGIAPKLIETIDCDGRTGLVLELLDGPDMLSLLQRQPWRVLGLAHALAGAHLAVHQAEAPVDLPEVRQVLAARINHAVMPFRLRDYAMRVLDGLPDGDRLCHGDFHPGNVLLAAGRVAVIDWPGAARGTPEADHARTRLLLRWADPLPGTSPVFRALITAGRSMFAHGYARAYRRGASQPLRRSDSWLIVHAAARLSEGIEVEHPTLIAFLSRSRQKAAR
jgi:hypothetical protein